MGKGGETLDMLLLGPLLGERPHVLVTTRPKPGPVFTRVKDSTGRVLTRGKTRENPHMPSVFVETVEELCARTPFVKGLGEA